MKGFGFKNAARGIKDAVRTSRNVRVHVSAMVCVSALGIILHVGRKSWAALAICFGMVIAAEMFNTAIEALCDKLHPGRDDAIKLCKDIAAGAVLITALASVGVGAAIFARPALWRGADPVILIAALVILAVFSALFIFFGGRKK